MYTARKALDKLQRDGAVATFSRGTDILQRWFYRRTIAKHRASKLTSQDYQPDRVIGEAISETVSGTIPDPATEHIEKIENYRSEIRSSTETITVTDYGASSEEEKETEDRQVSDAAMSPPHYARLLFQLAYQSDAGRILELGTSVGVSAAYQATALDLNGEGELVTLEGADPLADLAEAQFRSLGLSNVRVVRGQFAETLPDVLDRQFDMVFIDGHHDEEATKRYFDRIEPTLAEKAIVVFDDIAWSDGMKRAWRTLRHDSRLTPVVSTDKFGVCAADDTGRTEPERILL